MDIRFEETTRGTGMVFIRVEAVGFEEPVTLSAENTTVEGRKLPVELYPIERFGDYVVAFPVFGLPQRIAIRAHDKDGRRGPKDCQSASGQASFSDQHGDQEPCGPLYP